MRSVSARVLGKKEGERATSKEETTMISPRKRERERIGIRPPKMRNEKKKKNNEGQPRARFLPFSEKKRFTARASKKGPPELGFGGGGGGVVEEVCVFCGDSLTLSFSLYNNCLFLFSFLPPSFFPLRGIFPFLRGKHIF